jgi:hypothetical protein
MYTNIETTHAINAFRVLLATNAPEGFPTEMFLTALHMVMTTNIFQFDDTFWVQKTSAAMGTPCACLYATLYYAAHERNSILPRHSTNLLYYRRFIDDIFGIWVGTNDECTLFQQQLPFGQLQWETSLLTTDSIAFLDLEVSSIASSELKTKMFQKACNLFLYIPPHSAHPPGVLKSVIYGNLRRFFLQNEFQNFITITKSFRSHLIARGHQSSDIDPLFLSAAERLDVTASSTLPSLPERTLFLTWQYHPRGSPASID